MKAKQTQNKSKASLRSTYVYGMYWQRAIYMLFSLNFSFELVLIQGSSMEVLCSDHLHLVLLGKPASGAKFWSWNHEILHWYILFISFIVCTLSLCNWKSKDFGLRCVKMWRQSDGPGDHWRGHVWIIANIAASIGNNLVGIRTLCWSDIKKRSALRALFWNRVIWLAFTSKIHCVSDPNVSDAAEEPKSQTGSKAVRASLNSSKPNLLILVALKVLVLHGTINPKSNRNLWWYKIGRPGLCEYHHGRHQCQAGCLQSPPPTRLVGPWSYPGTWAQAGQFHKSPYFKKALPLSAHDLWFFCRCFLRRC